jgi:putative ABC transport system substrate-binding protein
LPQAKKVGDAANPNFSETENDVKEVAGAARAIGLQVLILKAGNAYEIDTSFAALAEQGADAAHCRRSILKRAACSIRRSCRALFNSRDLLSANSLRPAVLSYGPNFENAYHIVGNYADRILKGEKAGDLPVQESTKVELFIDLKTAKTPGLKFPITLLGRADEVIE